MGWHFGLAFSVSKCSSQDKGSNHSIKLPFLLLLHCYKWSVLVLGTVLVSARLATVYYYIKIVRYIVWRNIVPLSLGNSPRRVLGLFPEGEGTVFLCSSRSDFWWLNPEDEDPMRLRNASNYLAVDKVWHPRRLEPLPVLHVLCVVTGRKAAKKKLNSYLMFPQNLDISLYLNKPTGSLCYVLSAVLIHRGHSTYSGHYVG
jgi:hypothetical protein